MSGSADDPRPVREGLERFLRHLGAPPVDVVTELEGRWEEIVGPALASTSQPLELVDGVLVIACDDAAWAAQIGWMEHQIIERFGAVFDDLSVRQVVARTR